MGELAGKTAEVYILAGAVAMTDSTGAKVNGVDNASLNEMANLLDISQFGDDYVKRMAGLKDSSFNLSGNYDPDDTNGQNVIVPGASLYVGLYPKGSAQPGRQVPAIVESVEWSAAVDGKQEFSATIQGNGEPVALPAQV